MTRVVYVRSPFLEKAVKLLINSLGLDYVDARRVYAAVSFRSLSKAYARIWGLPSPFTKLGLCEPSYLIELIYENASTLECSTLLEILIHELLHIPRTFSGSLRGHGSWVARERLRELARRIPSSVRREVCSLSRQAFREAEKYLNVGGASTVDSDGGAVVCDTSLVPRTGGVYAVLFLLGREFRGKLGGSVRRLAPGLYLYVGSAYGPGGLRARLRRHLEGVRKRLKWHIDYLLAADQATPIAASYVAGGVEVFLAAAGYGSRCLNPVVPPVGSTDDPYGFSHLFTCRGTLRYCISCMTALLSSMPGALSTLLCGHDSKIASLGRACGLLGLDC